MVLGGSFFVVLLVICWGNHKILSFQWNDINWTCEKRSRSVELMNLPVFLRKSPSLNFQLFLYFLEFYISDILSPSIQLPLWAVQRGWHLQQAACHWYGKVSAGHLSYKYQKQITNRVWFPSKLKSGGTIPRSSNIKISNSLYSISHQCENQDLERRGIRRTDKRLAVFTRRLHQFMQEVGNVCIVFFKIWF